MPTYATITGPLTYADTDEGIYARIVATPQTDGQAITLDDRTTLGPTVVETDPTTGAFSFRVPVTSAPVLWEVYVKPLRSLRNGQTIEPWVAGVFPITGSTTFRSLIPTSVLAVDPTVITNLGALVGSAQSASAGAVAAAAQTQAAAATVLATLLATGFVGTDTDGAPFYAPRGTTPAGTVYLDTDGVPYVDATGAGGVPLIADLDSIPYLYGV